MNYPGNPFVILDGEKFFYDTLGKTGPQLLGDVEGDPRQPESDDNWPGRPKDVTQGKRDEIGARWEKSLIDGVPVIIGNGANAKSGVVRYTERDQTRYAAVFAPNKVPAPGLLVVTLTLVNGKMRFVISGTQNITDLLEQLLRHRNMADIAWDRGQSDLDAMASEPAADIKAYDIEALPWPSNV